jgi:hypothetical protein
MDFKNANIRLTDTIERDTFRHKVDKWEVTSEQPKQKQNKLFQKSLLEQQEEPKEKLIELLA